MKLRLIKTSALILITLFVAACTVQKRIHRPGYTITWKKSQDSKSENIETRNQTGTSNTTQSEPFSEELTSHPSSQSNPRIAIMDDAVIGMVESTSTATVETLESENSIENSSPFFQLPSDTIPNQRAKRVRKKREKGVDLATSSLILSILGLIVFPIATLLTGPLAISLGAKALRIIKESPDKEKGRKRAIAGIIIGAISLFIIIAIILLYILALLGLLAWFF